MALLRCQQCGARVSLRGNLLPVVLGAIIVAFLLGLALNRDPAKSQVLGLSPIAPGDVVCVGDLYTDSVPAAVDSDALAAIRTAVTDHQLAAVDQLKGTGRIRRIPNGECGRVTEVIEDACKLSFIQDADSVWVLKLYVKQGSPSTRPPS